MTDDTSDDTPASEQFDLTTGMEFDLNHHEVNEFAQTLEQAESYPAASADSDTLADFAAACKRLADAAEDARKEVFEDELDRRIDEGETVGPLVKQSGRNTWVTDDEAAFVAVAEAGEDPMDVASVSIGDLRDVLGADADEFIGESTYSYFRRQA